MQNGRQDRACKDCGGELVLLAEISGRQCYRCYDQALKERGEYRVTFYSE